MDAPVPAKNATVDAQVFAERVAILHRKAPLWLAITAIVMLVVMPALPPPALAGHRAAFTLFIVAVLVPMLLPMARSLFRIGDHIPVAPGIATAVYGTVSWAMDRRPPRQRG